MNYVTFLPARGVGTAVPEPSWKASIGMEAHTVNTYQLLQQVGSGSRTNKHQASQHRTL